MKGILKQILFAITPTAATIAIAVIPPAPPELLASGKQKKK